MMPELNTAPKTMLALPSEENTPPARPQTATITINAQMTITISTGTKLNKSMKELLETQYSHTTIKNGRGTAR